MSDLFPQVYIVRRFQLVPNEQGLALPLRDCKGDESLLEELVIPDVLVREYGRAVGGFVCDYRTVHLFDRLPFREWNAEKPLIESRGFVSREGFFSCVRMIQKAIMIYRLKNWHVL